MWQELAAAQAGIITRQQALAAGLSDAAIDAQVEAQRWQRVYPGVLATFSGSLSRTAQIWAALSSCGSGAVISHQTAAELTGLVSETGPLVHVTVPAGRRPAARRGVVLHRSRNVAAARHPVLEPPRTRVEETVVDLTQSSPDLDTAFGWLIRAVASRRTTPNACLPR
jgi:predicted transcriptional regulator of viral defense system